MQAGDKLSSRFLVLIRLSGQIDFKTLLYSLERGQVISCFPLQRVAQAAPRSPGNLEEQIRWVCLIGAYQ